MPQEHVKLDLVRRLVSVEVENQGLRSAKYSRDQIIAALLSCARELGRTPTLADLGRLSGVTCANLRTHFQGMGEAVREAGLEPPFTPVAHEALLADWARVARQLGKLPSWMAYKKLGQHSVDGIRRRMGSWAGVPVHFLKLVKSTGVENEWQDVLEMIAEKMRLESPTQIRARNGDAAPPLTASDHSVTAEGQPVAKHQARGALAGRPLAGNPLSLPGLAQEPTNEAGVLYLFGMMSHRLGFHVISLQASFPDCEAMREVKPGRWQRVRVEFEFESRNFKDHGHDPDLCDVIVCWQHNWPGCPVHLEVVELSKVVKGL
jgi:hypothetical protein